MICYFLFKLRQDEDENRFTKAVQKAHSKIYNFTCRAKQDTFNVSAFHVLRYFEVHDFHLGSNPCALWGDESIPIRLRG